MYIGIDIGGTNIKLGVVDSSGDIIYIHSFKTDVSAGPLANLEQIKNSIYKMITQFPAVQSIGIGAPGIFDNSGGLCVSPNLQNWHGINIQNELKKDFNLTIAVDNDANAAAVAEMELGAGKELSDFIYTTLGTGIGGCIVFGRKIFRGSTGAAGEIGHTIINYDSIKKDIPSYRQGIMEELAGRKAIITNYQLLITNDDFGRSISSNFDVEDIANFANEGNESAIKCIEDTGKIIGIGLASAMNLLDIHVAIVGGGISQSGDILYDSIRKTIKEHSLPTISESFEVKEAFFKNNTGIIGAAMLGLNKLKEKSQ